MVFIIVISLILFLVLLFTSITWIVPTNKRMQIFRLGEYIRAAEPGMVFLMPLIDKGIIVNISEREYGTPINTSEREYNIPLHRAQTKDKHFILIRTVLYGRIINPELSLTQGDNLDQLIKNRAIVNLRKLVSNHDVKTLLADPRKITSDYREELNQIVNGWGVEIAHVNDIDIIDVVGKHGRVIETLDPIGTIEVKNEIWYAISGESVEAGTPIIVTNQDGLQLYVEPLAEKETFKKKKSL